MSLLVLTHGKGVMRLPGQLPESAPWVSPVLFTHHMPLTDTAKFSIEESLSVFVHL